MLISQYRQNKSVKQQAAHGVLEIRPGIIVTFDYPLRLWE